MDEAHNDRLDSLYEYREALELLYYDELASYRIAQKRLKSMANSWAIKDVSVAQALASLHLSSHQHLVSASRFATALRRVNRAIRVNRQVYKERRHFMEASL